MLYRIFNCKHLNIVNNRFRNRIREFSKQEHTRTKIGSLNYLLFGSTVSKQSILIKLGMLGEEYLKMFINYDPEFELFPSGIIKLQNNKKKDFDLIWLHKEKEILYYRELKSNINLDTEKIQATIYKINLLDNELKCKYPKYRINSGILNWSIYDKEDSINNKYIIKKFENNNIKVDFFNDFLNILNIDWSKVEFYKYWRELGDIIKNKQNRKSPPPS